MAAVVCGARQAWSKDEEREFLREVRAAQAGAPALALDWDAIAQALAARMEALLPADTPLAARPCRTGAMVRMRACTGMAGATGSLGLAGTGQCFLRYQRFFNGEMLRSAWTPDEDEALRRAVRCHGDRDWQAVARELPGRTGSSRHPSPRTR